MKPRHRNYEKGFLGDGIRKLWRTDLRVLGFNVLDVLVDIAQDEGCNIRLNFKHDCVSLAHDWNIIVNIN